MSLRVKYYLLLQVGILGLLMPILAQSVTIDVENNWKGIFSGRTVPYEISLLGKKDSTISLSWKLITNGRTLSNDRQLVKFNNSREASIKLSLRTPPLKPGVNLKAKLIIETLLKEAPSAEKITHEFKLNLYGPDLFSDKKAFFKQLNIQLFDPSGHTAELLDEINIPYTRMSKSQLFNLANTGVVIIGADLRLEEQRGLVNQLTELARAGYQILILKPSSGGIPLASFTNDEKNQLSKLLFAGTPITPIFSKYHKWIKNDPMRTHGIELYNERRTVTAEIVGRTKDSLSWLQVEYSRSGGKFIICMLPIISYTNQSPTPQLILVDLLTYMLR